MRKKTLSLNFIYAQHCIRKHLRGIVVADDDAARRATLLFGGKIIRPTKKQIRDKNMD